MKLALLVFSALLLAQTTITSGQIGGTVAVSSPAPMVLLSQVDLVREERGTYPPCRHGLVFRNGLLQGKGDYTRNVDGSITILTGPDDLITCVTGTLYNLERIMP